MKAMKELTLILIACMITSSCIEEPAKEDVPELISKVKLTFTPANGPIIEAVASDPDGEGIQDLNTMEPIVLTKNQSYIMSVALFNELADATSPAYNVTEEVEEEGTEHLFFYEWTEGMFSLPTGDGNVDNRLDLVDYQDADSNGLPIGLLTAWTAQAYAGAGKLRIILKHQPQLKSSTSNAEVGETDLDVTFDLQIQ